jgi:hypothetical protein
MPALHPSAAVAELQCQRKKAAKGNTLPRRSTRNAILEAAMEQFTERGYSAPASESSGGRDPPRWLQSS